MPAPLGSPPFSLSADDWKKIGIGALLAMFGGLSAYITAQVIPLLNEKTANDLGALLVALAATALPIVANIIRKFLGDTTTPTKLLWIGAVLSLTICGSTSAGEVAVMIDDSKAGNFLLTVGADGAISVNPIRVVRPGPSPNPTPTPPAPTPAVLTEMGKYLRDISLKVTGDPDRSTTAQGLALVYRELAKQAKTPGAVKDIASLEAVLKQATDLWLTKQAALSQWQPFRDAFSSQWTLVKTKTGTVASLGGLLDDAASGLEASVLQQQRGINPELLAFLLELLKILLPLLLK